MQIKIGGVEVQLIENLSDVELESLFPSGVLKFTHRNPFFGTFLETYGQILSDRVLTQQFDVLADEVKAFHYIGYARSVGYLIEVTRE